MGCSLIVAVATAAKKPDKADIALWLIQQWIEKKKTGEIRIHFSNGGIPKVEEKIVH